MKIPKFIKTKSFFKNLPKILGEQAFFTFLFLFFLVLLISGAVFYQYSVSIEKAEPKVIQAPIQFKENLCQKVLKEWENRQKRFEEALQKEYLDPFQEKIEESPNSIPETNQENLTLVSYTVLKEETLWEIAKRYLGSGERWRELKTETGQAFTEGSAQRLQPGQKLIIPSK